MTGPRYIRIVARVAAVSALVIAAIALWWMLAGLPRPVASALADADWEPCVARYADARVLRDTQRVDTYVLKPRSRFTRAVTCGGLRAKRDSGVAE